MPKLDNDDRIIWDDEARPPEDDRFSNTGGWLGAMPAIMMGVFYLIVIGLIASAVYRATGNWGYVVIIVIGGLLLLGAIIREIVR